ncbi:MAG: hypothetical protein R2865_08765 [Deinococcales bacterium]
MWRRLEVGDVRGSGKGLEHHIQTSSNLILRHHPLAKERDMLALQGILPILFMPFNQDGNIDEASLIKILHFELGKRY